MTQLPYGSTLDRLKKAPAPAYEVVYRREYSTTDLTRARRGIVRVHDRDINILPAVDWQAAGPPTFQAYLHSLFFLDPLLRLYLTQCDPYALDLATDCALDWLAKHPLDTPSSTYAWNDKATGDRAPYIAYLLRLGLHRNALSNANARKLLQAVKQHGAVLADDTQYSAHTNHGLFQDQGLLLLAKYMNGFIAEAATWRSVAERRLQVNLEAHTDLASGLWLEHSSSYQTVIVNILRRLRSWELLKEGTLRRIQNSLEEAANWLVAADGYLAQIGDTNLIRAPKWVKPQKAVGLRAFMEAGWAIVKCDSSSLFVTASHHSKAHKHPDELSFELCERGVKAIIDPGLYAYDPSDPLRRYALSPQGHNSLVVDDQDLNVRKLTPYGSGLVEAISEGDSFKIVGTNPHLQRRNVAHRRYFDYVPGRYLRITDELLATSIHTYKRYFHFAPHLEATLRGSAVVLTGDRLIFTLSDEDGTTPSLIDGWAFPSYRKALRGKVAVFQNQAANAKLTVSILINDACS